MIWYKYTRHIFRDNTFIHYDYTIIDYIYIIYTLTYVDIYLYINMVIINQYTISKYDHYGLSIAGLLYQVYQINYILCKCINLFYWYNNSNIYM